MTNQKKKRRNRLCDSIAFLLISTGCNSQTRRPLTVTVLPEIIINFLNKKNNAFKVNKQWIFFFLISGKFSSSPERLITAKKQWQSAFYMMWDLAFCLFL